MAQAVSEIAFGPSTVRLQGPHDATVEYLFQVPSGSSGSEIWIGPIDAPGQGQGPGQIYFHASEVTPSAADHVRFSVYGTFTAASAAANPTSRTWFGPMRGDLPSGTNQPLSLVTLGGVVAVITPARSYLIRLNVSGTATTLAGAVNVRVLTVKSNW